MGYGVGQEAQTMIPESKGEKKGNQYVDVGWFDWESGSWDWEHGAGCAKVRRALADHGWNPHLDLVEDAVTVSSFATTGRCRVVRWFA